MRKSIRQQLNEKMNNNFSLLEPRSNRATTGTNRAETDNFQVCAIPEEYNRGKKLPQTILELRKLLRNNLGKAVRVAPDILPKSFYTTPYTYLNSDPELRGGLKTSMRKQADGSVIVWLKKDEKKGNQNLRSAAGY